VRISAAVLRGWRTIGSARQGKAPAAADVMKQMLALYVAGSAPRLFLLVSVFRFSRLCLGLAGTAKRHCSVGLLEFWLQVAAPQYVF
jgi:hypothetical protein